MSVQNGVKYIDTAGLKAMVDVAAAAKKRSLEEFEAAVWTCELMSVFLMYMLHLLP